MRDMKRNDFTDDVWEKDRRHVIHPWHMPKSFDETGSTIMSEARGCWITDITGRKFLDGLGGVWCVNVGWGREEIVEAMAEQARKLAYTNPWIDLGNEPAALLAARLADLAPGDLNRVFFSSGGSTANDSAFRIIQFYWGCQGKKNRRHIITRMGSYHGSTYLTQMMSGKFSDRSPEFDYRCDFVHHVTEPNLYRRPLNMTAEEFTDFLIKEFEDKVLELGEDNVAAYFAEPILGAGGVIVPPRRCITAVREICRRYGIIYVSDEVVTAFGRLGEWFASKAVFDIQPDMIVCAKGLSSAYAPLGATIFSDAIYDVIAEKGYDRMMTNGFTYSGHPVSCAVALKNIEILERENLLGYVKHDIGPYFMERLNSLRDMPTVGDIRGMHLMGCVVNVANKETRENLPTEVNIGGRIAKACQQRNLIVRPIANLNVLSPALTVTRAEVDEMISILREAMEEVIADLRSEGVKLG